MNQEVTSRAINPIRVLLVDDEENQVEFTKFNLESADSSLVITTTSTPSDALNLLRDQIFDCIISDYQMPAMNGVELCIEVRKMSTIPFIIYTGRGSEEVASSAFDAGADDYVWKEKDLSHYRILARRIRHTAEKRYAEKFGRAREIETKRLIDSIQHEKDKLSALVNSIQDEVWFADAEKRFTLVNQSALKTFGLNSTEPGIDVEQMASSLEVYRPDGSVRSVEEAPPLRALKGEVISGEEEIIMDPVSEELRYREVSAAPVRDASGKVIGSVCVVRDITEQKMVEEEIRAAKEKLDAALLNSPVFAFGHDINLRYTWVYNPNPALSKEQLVGKTDEEIMGTQGEALARVKRRVLETGVGTRTEVELIGEGKKFYYDTTIEPTRDSYGNITGLICAAVDVTERKNMEEELRVRNRELAAASEELINAEEELRTSNEREQVYAKQLEQLIQERTEELREASLYTRSLIEASLDPLVTINAEGKITDVNAATVQATGSQREELIGSDFDEYFTDPEKAREIRRKAFANGYIRDYPLTIRHKSGSTTDVLYNASVYKNPAGEIAGIFAAARDVGSLKRAETGLRAASLYTRSLIEASLDPLITISAEGKITDVNEATVQATGVPREQLIGSEFSDYFTDPDKARQGYQTVFKEGRVIDYPLAIRHRTGKTMDVLYNAVVYRGEEGDVKGVFAAARDVTERRRLESELVQAERMDALGKLTAMLAHDLRNPLNFISQASELARRQPDKADRMLRLIGESAARSLGMIEELRTSTREISLQRTNVDVAQLIRKIVEETQIPEKIKFEALIGDKLGTWSIDAELIHRVMDNLMNNAIEAMPNGGKLTVRASSDGTAVQIEVEDTGIGIPADAESRIFDPSYSTKLRGIGLGLVFSRRAVEAHGGTLSFKTKRGVGATFIITLPLRS